MWKYIKPYFEKWGYTPSYAFCSYKDIEDYPLLIINTRGQLGIYNDVALSCHENYNRELISSVEEFLERTAALKGFIYKRKDIMKINGIDIEPGMVITTEDNTNYIAFPTREGIAFVNNACGGWQVSIPRNIVRISDLTEGGNINNGSTLWEKPKEIVITMKDIAKKFNCKVEQIRIKE